MISQALRDQIEQIAQRYPQRPSALMPALDLAQRLSHGYIPPEDLTAIGEILGLSTAEVFGVWTYYSMYNKVPVGKYHLQIDCNIPALLMGADEILAHLEEILQIKVGQTTPDGLFTLSKVQDLGSCGSCPIIQVNDRYYENMTVEKVDQLIASLRNGIMPDWKNESYFYSDCHALLRRRGKENSTSIDTYLADGGYQALEKALGASPQQVIDQVKESFLRGLGGAGFPTGTKWGFLPKQNHQPVYLICNADEGEPGTFKDRQIMEYDPHLLLEGMAISAFAIGAHLAFIYIRGEFAWIADILERAINEAYAKNKLGKNILGKGFDLDIIVHRGAGAYVCGEETALIESLEGKRGDPRLKPPFPAAKGLYNRPTIVNNVETLSSVPYIIANGPSAYKQFGSSNNYGFKIFGVSGHVHKPGVYEFAMGTPLKKILDAAGGVKGALKAVIVGGLSVPILTAQEAGGLNMDFDGCLQKDTMLGSGGIIVINHDTSIPLLTLRTIRFYAHESCGQCTPCREGSWAIEKLLEKILARQGCRKDIDQVLWLCQTIKGSTLCPTGDAFALPISAMIRKFRGEFDALVTN